MKNLVNLHVQSLMGTEQLVREESTALLRLLQITVSEGWSDEDRHLLAEALDHLDAARDCLEKLIDKGEGD